MNTVSFLEKLANDVHYSDAVGELILIQPDKIREAYFANDAEKIKKQLSNTEYFSDSIAVVSVVTD